MIGDLHFHSLLSDGSKDIDYLVTRAAGLKLEVASLTDHDTFAGCREFSDKARAAGIIPVSGIELSSQDKAEIHILGYGVDYEANNALTSELANMQAVRLNRIHMILDKLKGHGIAIPIEEVLGGGTKSVGRKHLAAAMVDRGIVKDIAMAFELFLGEGKPCYVRNAVFTPCEAVEVIAASGGIAVLAHPGRIRMNRTDFEDMLKKLIGAGLGGIETYYPAHSNDMIEYYISLANKYKLLVTNGSDYHDDDGRPEINYRLRAETVKALIG